MPPIKRARKLVSAEYHSSEDEDDVPLSVLSKQIAKRKPARKKPYAVVGHYEGNREWDEVFWTKEEFEAYKRRSDQRIRAMQAKAQLPNSGNPPDFVVGEKVFCRLGSVCAHVCVKRVWIDKAAMDKDVQPVFRDASQICAEYLGQVAASEEDNRAKHNVKSCNKHAWYEIIWYAHERMRVILPQTYLQSNRGPREPRPMVTDADSGGLPKPSEWHKFEAGYDSGAE